MKKRIVTVFLMLATLFLISGCERKSANISQSSSSEKVLQKDDGLAATNNSTSKSKDTSEVTTEIEDDMSQLDTTLNNLDENEDVNDIELLINSLE